MPDRQGPGKLFGHIRKELKTKTNSLRLQAVYSLCMSMIHCARTASISYTKLNYTFKKKNICIKLWFEIFLVILFHFSEFTSYQMLNLKSHFRIQYLLLVVIVFKSLYLFSFLFILIYCYCWYLWIFLLLHNIYGVIVLLLAKLGSLRWI